LVVETQSREAITAWIDTLTDSIFFLHEFQQHFPEEFQSIAEQRANWPGLVSADVSIQRETDAVVKLLRLGAKADLNFKGSGPGRRIDRNKAETNNVRNYYGLLEMFRLRPLGKRNNYASDNGWFDSAKLAKKLQPLTRSNFKSWWAAAQPLFFAQYGKQFEDHPDFKRHWPKAQKRGDKQQRKTRGVVRTSILGRHLQAFKSIAPRS
jgi:hypothetical protein